MVKNKQHDEWCFLDFFAIPSPGNLTEYSFSQIPDKEISQLVKHYYTWKKSRMKMSWMDRQATKRSHDRLAATTWTWFDLAWYSLNFCVIFFWTVMILNRKMTSSLTWRKRWILCKVFCFILTSQSHLFFAFSIHQLKCRLCMKMRKQNTNFPKVLTGSERQPSPQIAPVIYDDDYN